MYDNLTKTVMNDIMNIINFITKAWDGGDITVDDETKEYIECMMNLMETFTEA